MSKIPVITVASSGFWSSVYRKLCDPIAWHLEQVTSYLQHFITKGRVSGLKCPYQDLDWMGQIKSLDTSALIIRYSSFSWVIFVDAGSRFLIRVL